MSRNILYTLAKNTKAIYVLATFFLLSICTTIQAEYGVGWGGINQPNVEFSVGFGATPLAACVQYDAVLDANGTGTPAVSYKILSSGATANAGFPPYVMSRPGCEMLYSSGFTDVAELYTIDDEPDPFKNGGGGGSCRVTAGNPINIATGNKFHSEIDFDRQSPSQVFFERFYNSISTSRGSMGGNWSTTYDRSIKIGTSSIIVFRPDGKSFKFTLNGSNWVSDADITDILKMNGGLWTYTTKDDSVETYNANGVLISIDYVNGQKLSLSYDSNNRLLNVVDLLNKQQLTFQYDGRDRISSVTDNADRRWIYNYDNNGNLTLVTYPDATKKQYHYANTVYRNALTGITDERNIRFSTYDYDIHGRAILSTHANNAGRISVVYNTDGTRTVTNGNVNDSSYGITSNLGTALVSSITGPACTSCANGDTNIFYDSSNNIISKNEFGTTIQYGDYDNLGNPGYKIEAAGTSEERRIDYTYDPTFHSRVATIIEPSVVDDQNKVTTYTYDDFGNRTAITVSGFAPDGGAGFVPVSRTTTFKYDGPLNQLSEIDGPRRNNEVIDLTYLSYYPNDVTEDFNRARLKQLIGPEGIVLRDNIQYTATGKVLSEQRPNGVSIAYIYYPGNDRLDTLTEADGTNIRVTKWTYLATGEVETITQAFGTTLATTITLGYDDARRLTSITDNLGNKIVYTLDTEGNKIQDDIKDVGGVLFRTVQQTFDAYNRLDTRTLIDEVMDFNIAPDGTLDNQTDANNISTDYNYDSLKRLTSVTGDLGGADPNTQDTLTQYVYDVADRLTNVITPNDATTEYVYDDLGNLLKETSPDRGTRTYTYDEAGNVKTITDARGITATYSYDGLNRVIGIDYPGTEEDIVMTYDNCANGVGQLCQISDQSGTTDYVYSAFGNIIDHIKIEAGVSYTTHYEYDILNRVLQTTTPTGRVIDYGYDSLNRITHIDANINGAAYIIAHNAAYRADGPLTGFEFGNGFVDNRMYNLKGQLTAVSMPSEQSVMQPSQAVNDSATIDNDNGQPITVLSNDTYAVFNDVNISITTPASFGTAVVNSDKTITYIPNAGFIGIDTFAYQLNEGSDNSIATVDVTVIDGDFDNDGLTNSVDLDDDNDGIPDAWELSYGLDPLNAADAMLDLDGDGVSNFDEFTQGTDPSTKPIARITQNLQALYAFNEGAGSIINDVSGVGAALPLSITGDVVWTTTGIQLNNGVLVSSGVADKLITSLQASNEITIEAWLTPANISQSGPARIVTLSADPYQRNFTLGQAADAYDTRLRTTSTNNNGIPSIRSAAGTATTAQTHVAYTRDAAGKATLYVNGVEQLTSTIGGDLSNWNTGYRLAIGNELTNDRPWQGEVNLVAIYNRALSAGEMSQNHIAGPNGNSTTNQVPVDSADAMNNQRQLVVVSNDKMSHSQLRSKAKQATFITLRKGPETNHQWIQTAEDPNAYDRPDTVYYVTADNISVWQRAKSDEASNVASYQRMPFDAKALIAKLDRNEPSVDGFIKVNHGTPSNPISIDAETWTYAYDANGNVESILSSTGDHIYTYDALNRVIEDTRPSQSRETINYDRNGNRTGKTIDAITDTYNYIANSNKLDSDPVGQVTHDAAGNRISDQGGNRTFEYNNAGRLLKVYEGSTLNAEYVYNAQGQRTRKITPSGITVYHYDLAGNVISETTETGSPIRDYVYMGSIPVAQIDTDGTTDTLSYLHTDHLGTPRRATNEAGEVVWSWDSDAFGQTAANNDPDGDGNSTIINLRFAGQYFDSETKLHYNYFRYYDPQSGRYITSDPIGLIAGTNTYGYVLGNPLKYNDPLGLRTNCTQCILDCDTIFGWDMDDSSIYFVFGKDQCRGMMIGGTTCLYNFKFQYELEIRDNEFNQKQCILNCSSTCTEEGSNGCS